MSQHEQGTVFPGNLHLWFPLAKNASLKPLFAPILSPPAAIHHSTAVQSPCAALRKMNCCSHSTGSFAFFSAPRELGEFKESEPIVWIPSHWNCAWERPGSDEETYTPAVSNTVATSRVATANPDFFTAPSKITFTSTFLPHVSWAFSLALGNEGQPCNLSKRKPGSVLSPESYKGVTTELLCLSCFWEREYTALLLSAGTKPDSVLSVSQNKFCSPWPSSCCLQESMRWAEAHLFLPGGTMPLASPGWKRVTGICSDRYSDTHLYTNNLPINSDVATTEVWWVKWQAGLLPISVSASWVRASVGFLWTRLVEHSICTTIIPLCSNSVKGKPDLDTDRIYT